MPEDFNRLEANTFASYRQRKGGMEVGSCTLLFNLLIISMFAQVHGTTGQSKNKRFCSCLVLLLVFSCD